MLKIKTIHLIERVVAVGAAIILLQTLFFKFTAAPVSVHIFSTLGIEPWGRIATGVIELAAGILLLRSITSLFGALLAIGTMSGAIFSHLFILGIEVQNDGGSLFLLAMIVFICCFTIIVLKRVELFTLLSGLKTYLTKTQKK